MQIVSSSYWDFKSIVNAETYQSVIKWSNKSLFGSIIGKNVFYKTIAHKNTTSLKNNHNLLTAHIYYVQTSSKFQLIINLINQPVKIRVIIILISMIKLIKVNKETAYVLRKSVQSAVKKKHPSIHSSFQWKKKNKSWAWKAQNHICAFDVAFRYEAFDLSQIAQIWTEIIHSSA